MTTLTVTLAWWLILPVALTALIVLGFVWLWWDSRHQTDAEEGAKVLASVAAIMIIVVWALLLYGRWTA